MMSFLSRSGAIGNDASRRLEFVLLPGRSPCWDGTADTFSFSPLAASTRRPVLSPWLIVGERKERG